MSTEKERDIRPCLFLLSKNVILLGSWPVPGAATNPTSLTKNTGFNA